MTQILIFDSKICLFRLSTSAPMDIHLVRVTQYVDVVNVWWKPAKWGERPALFSVHVDSYVNGACLRVFTLLALRFVRAFPVRNQNVATTWLYSSSFQGPASAPGKNGLWDSCNSCPQKNTRHRLSLLSLTKITLTNIFHIVAYTVYVLLMWYCTLYWSIACYQRVFLFYLFISYYYRPSKYPSRTWRCLQKI